MVEAFFEKDKAAENGSVNFEIADIDTFAYLHWSLKKISCRTCLLSYCFFGYKIWFLKALFISTFILTLLSSELRKKIHTKAVIDVSRGTGGRNFLFFRRNWEGVCRNLLSLVKLYQRIWIWNLDQNLVTAVNTVLF